MDFPQSQPDPGAPDGTTSSRHFDLDGGAIRLPANVSTVLAEDLRARMVFAADHDEAIIVDASEVEAIGQAGLQLLIAARKEADRLDLPFALTNLSEPLFQRLVTLGVADALGIDVASDNRESA